MEAIDHVPGKKVSWGYWASLDQADGKPFLVQITFMRLSKNMLIFHRDLSNENMGVYL